MSTALVYMTNKLAATLGMGDGAELVSTLKATAFKGDVSDAQMTALLVVANQYRLNPWTKEIYAFPDKKNGIVPVVGVDGWARIINSHLQFDGMEFAYSDELVQMPSATSKAPAWIECRMYRKDRTRPVVVREYLDECYREPFKGQYGAVNGPWQSHPKRFLRHKATIQCARLAFGFGGIYDQDEADRIIEAPAKDITPRAEAIASTVEAASPALIESMRLAAEEGVAVYQEAWTSLTKDQRKSLAAYHEQNKQIAAAADAARTVEATPAPAEQDDFLAQMEAEEARQ